MAVFRKRKMGLFTAYFLDLQQGWCISVDTYLAQKVSISGIYGISQLSYFRESYNDLNIIHI